MKKALSTVLSAMLLLSLLAACGNSDAGGAAQEQPAQETAAAADAQDVSEEAAETPDTADGDAVTISFTWWGGQERADATVKAAERFMELNPDIIVETSFQPFDNYWDNLSMLASTGSMPDVFQGYVGSGDSQMFHDKGLVASLDPYIEVGLIDVSNIDEGTLGTGLMNGEVQGIALGVNALAMVVDPDIYEEAGLAVPEYAYDSWADLEADLRVIEETTGVYGADDFLSYETILIYYCRQRGEQRYASEGDSIIGFSEQTFTDFYNMKLAWADEGLIPPIDVTLTSKAIEDSQIVRGNAGVSALWTSQYGQYTAAAGKELKMILLPGPGTGPATDMRAGMHICMSSQSEYPEQAARFIGFMLNDVEIYQQYLGVDRGMPASSEVREALEANFTASEMEISDTLAVIAEQSTPMDPPAMEGATTIDQLVSELEEQIMYKTLTPEDAYAQLAEAAQVG